MRKVYKTKVWVLRPLVAILCIILNSFFLDGDGQYGDSDSDSSNRLANRRTIHMLEKQRQKKKAIGTLDVAFKKRFFALNGQLAGQDGAPPEPGKIARKFIFTFFVFVDTSLEEGKWVSH